MDKRLQQIMNELDKMKTWAKIRRNAGEEYILTDKDLATISLAYEVVGATLDGLRATRKLDATLEHLNSYFGIVEPLQ